MRRSFIATTGAILMLLSNAAVAQSLEETKEFVKEAFSGCIQVTNVSEDRDVLSFDEGAGRSEPSRTSVDLRSIKASVKEPDALRAECVVGACISRDYDGEMKAFNSALFYCGTDMSHRLANAINHIHKNFGRKRRF